MAMPAPRCQTKGTENVPSSPICVPQTVSDAWWLVALNSSVIALITTVIAVLFGVMAAYPLARYQFRLREPLFLIFVLGLLFPAAVAIIPLFILVTRDLHMDNSFWGIALPQAAFALPMTVVILRPFLMAIPRELEEAALIDGASRIGIFWRLALPLSMPALVITGRLDPAATPQIAETIASKLPASRLTVLEDAAHLSNIEQPEAFAESVGAFLEETR